MIGMLLAAPAIARADEPACVALDGCAQGCACGDTACIEDRCEGEPSAEDQARAIAEREAAYQAQVLEAQKSTRAPDHDAAKPHERRADAAAEKLRWGEAIEALEAALLLAPADEHSQQDLENALAHEMLMVRAQDAALGPAIPSTLTPVAFTDAIPAGLPVAVPDAKTYLETVSAFFIDAALQAGRDGWIDPLDDWNNEIDFTTVDGICIRAKVDVPRLPREVSRLTRSSVRRAPAGTATLEVRPEAIARWAGTP